MPRAVASCVQGFDPKSYDPVLTVVGGEAAYRDEQAL
jgi:hypothetical protein